MGRLLKVGRLLYLFFLLVDYISDLFCSLTSLPLCVPPVLTRLVSTSLHDDLYGVVQRDIPKIIEALLSYLSAVEEFEAELKRRETALRESEDREKWEREGYRYDKAGKVVGGVRDGECFFFLILNFFMLLLRLFVTKYSRIRQFGLFCATLYFLLL
jgi:hypothetical protein